LPRFQELETAVPVVAAPTLSVQGSETILVVEDEPAVLELVRQALNRQGYTVLSAGDVHEALRICREHRGEIGLLLTDIVMPGMSGPQLVEQIVQLRKGIRVLYMSGYSDTAIEQPAPAPALFQKPFTPSALARKVREVLDSRDVASVNPGIVSTRH